METFLIIGSILSMFLSAAGSFMQSKQQEDNLQRSMDYNSVSNQMKQYKEAGLNPNLATGGFVPVGMSPSNVSSPAGSMMQAMSSALGNSMNLMGNQEMRDIKRLSADNQIAKLELEKQKYTLLEQQVKQALDKGQIDIAMALLNYDTAVKTQGDVISNSHNNANIIKNKSDMSDYEASTYQEYRDGIIDEIINRGNHYANMDELGLRRLAHEIHRDKSSLRLSAARHGENVRHNKAMENAKDVHEEHYIDYLDEKQDQEQREFIKDVVEDAIDVGLTVISRGRRSPRISPRRGISPNKKF